MAPKLEDDEVLVHIGWAAAYILGALLLVCPVIVIMFTHPNGHILHILMGVMVLGTVVVFTAIKNTFVQSPK